MLWALSRKWLLELFTLECHFPQLEGTASVRLRGKREPRNTCISHVLVTNFLSHVMRINFFETSSKKDPLLHTQVSGLLTHEHAYASSQAPSLSSLDWKPCTLLGMLKIQHKTNTHQTALLLQRT